MGFYRFWYGGHRGIVQASNSNGARTMVRDQYGHNLGDIMVKEVEFLPSYVGGNVPQNG